MCERTTSPTLNLLVSERSCPVGATTVLRRKRRTHYVSGHRVALFDGVEAGQQTIRVELLEANGRVVGTRTVAHSVTATTAVTVLISRSCRGVVCPSSDDPSATECSGGRCVSPECGEFSSDLCPTQMCSTSDECSSLAACAEGICTAEGVCLFAPRAGSCLESE